MQENHNPDAIKPLHSVPVSAKAGPHRAEVRKQPSFAQLPLFPDSARKRNVPHLGPGKLESRPWEQAGAGVLLNSQGPARKAEILRFCR